MTLSVAFYEAGQEALGFAQQEMYPRRFLHAFGSPNFLSVNSLCYVGRYLAYRLVQGYWNPCPDFAVLLRR